MKQSLSNFSNYMAIDFSSIFNKIIDWVILIKEGSALCSSYLHYSMQGTVNYYNFNQSNVFKKMLDDSKAFDRVNY